MVLPDAEFLRLCDIWSSGDFSGYINARASIGGVGGHSGGLVAVCW